MQTDQLSRQGTSQARSSEGFIGNTIDNPKNESCKPIKLRNRLVPSNQKVSDMRKETSEGENFFRKETIVEKEVEKKNQREEKVRKTLKMKLRGLPLTKFIDKNSPWRGTKKQILNEPNPKLIDYTKLPYLI